MESSERADYLKKTFPAPISPEYDAPGGFTEQACEYLAQPIAIELAQSGTLYVLVDAMEPNGNPLREMVRFRFRLAADRSRYEGPRLGGLDEPLKGSTEAVYYFHFSSACSLDENIEEMRTFIAEHLEDELVPKTAPVTAGPEKTEAWRTLVPLAIVSVGVAGLIAVDIVAAESAIALVTSAATAIIGIIAGLISLIVERENASSSRRGRDRGIGS
jgi:hypothetical protein